MVSVLLCWRWLGRGGAGLLLGEAFDDVQPQVPSRRGARHGLGGCVEALGADGVSDLPALAVCFHESGAGQDREVLGDGPPGEGQLGG